MRRGDIISVAASGPYASKPCPAIIVQADEFEIPSVTVCLLTTDAVNAPITRLRIEPDQVNGLRQPSWIMVDKIASLPRAKVGKVMGRLRDEDILRLDRSLAAFLGLEQG